MTPNAALAYMVLDHIDAHPDSWDQSSWICGTKACFAGWAVLLSGGVLEQSDPEETDEVYVVDGPAELVGMYVSNAAERLLGHSRFLWTGDLAPLDLFDAFNSREDLGRLVAEIFGPRPERAS